jgi:hypothetical protein
MVISRAITGFDVCHEWQVTALMRGPSGPPGAG